MNKLSIIFLLLVTSSLAVEVSINNLDPVPAEAGRVVNVWFKVENPDFQDSETGVRLTIDPQDFLELAEGEPATKNIGILGPGASQIVQYRLFVQDDAFEGLHTIVASVQYDGGSFSKDLTIQVTEKDFKEVDLIVGDVESDPARIKPDDDNVKIDVTILNLGDGRAQAVRTELGALPAGVEASESYSATSLLGNVEADSSAVATFYLDIGRETMPGEYNTNLKVSYKYKPDEEEDAFVFEEKQIPMVLAIKPIPLYEISKVELTPETLTAGDKVTLRMTVTNIGEEEGESVRIKAYIKSEQPFSFDKSSDFIAPSLKPGESGQGTLEFDIDDDANLQKYYLDLEIKSLVNDDVVTSNEKIEVVVANPRPNNPWTAVIIIGSIALIVIAYFVYRAVRQKKPAAKKAKGKYGESYLK